jgi:hypothetical protein
MAQAAGLPFVVDHRFFGDLFKIGTFLERIMRRSCLLAVFLLLLSASFSIAQFDTSAVLGFVRDSSGAPIPGSKVTLVNLATGVTLTATTDGEGHFQFSDVHIGRFKVSASAPGFSDSVTDPFAVNVNTRQRVDVTLKPGSVSETVTVSGAATQLESETSSIGTVISETQVHDLPLNGRAYGDLMSLAPGVRRNNLENQSVTSRDASYNVNGQRSEFNNFLLDGLDNNAYGTSNQGFSNQAIPPSPDAINQFRIETNNYSAEFGRASGAVINVSINSGTNQVHGKLWEYHRNTIFNAIGPFAPPINKLTGKSQKPALIRNQFGGAIGGPILHDRLFFFGDYEGNRQVQATYATATIPTDLQRQGIFQTTAGAPVPLRNPITGTVYANGIVPQTDWTPLATLVIAALPAPNVAGFSNNFASFPRATLTDDKGDGRLDYILSTKTAIFGRYSDHKGDIVDATSIPGDAGDGGNGTIHAYNRQIAAGITHSFSPSSTLDARIGFTWTHGGKAPYLAGRQSINVDAGIPGLPTDKAVIRRLSNESVKNFSTFGAQTSNPQFQNPFVINPKINYSLIKSHHSMKFGWEYLAINTEVDDFNPVYGGETFSQGFSQNGGGTSDAGAAAAAFLTDFLTGARDSYQLNNFRIVNYHQYMNYFYFQDDWKLLPSLTVNVGMRYELVTPQFTDGNHLANFDPTSNTLIQASSGSLYKRALVQTPKLDFAPRLGFAWQLNPATVIRAAYGISYDQFNREGGENLLAYNGPYIINSTVNQVAPFAFTGTKQSLCAGDTYVGCFRTVAQGYPSNFVDPSNFKTTIAQTRYIPKDIPTGYVQGWHFDVQREITKDTVFTGSYIGEHGVHIWVLADLNQAGANATGGTLSVQARRPIPAFTTIEESIPAGFLNYNALQAKLEHRFSGGLYLLNSFTWSHAIDNASGHLDTPNNDTSRVNLANLNGERGQSAYNQPINNTLSLVWDLPIGHGRKFASNMPRALDMALGGWELTGINTDTSGQPVNLIYSPSAAFQLSPLLNQRPNVSGNPVNPKASWIKTSTALNGYLSTANVTNPTDVSHPYGNAGRNSLRDMTFNQFDLGLHKSFRLWNEHSSFDLRGEAFNVLNKVNYMAPNSNRSSGSFGSITSAFPPRQLQVAGKLSF